MSAGCVPDKAENVAHRLAHKYSSMAGRQSLVVSRWSSVVEIPLKGLPSMLMTEDRGLTTVPPTC